MRLKSRSILSFLCLVLAASSVEAQAPITNLVLGPDQIGVVRTGLGITTRISFPEQVKEVICGDLYDPGTGKGGFVVQPSGRDVFLKPVVSKGMSNLFVKVGEKTERIYNFDLEVVAVGQAHRVVYVGEVNAARNQGDPFKGDRTEFEKQLEARRAESERKAREESDEIIRIARQQAARIVAEAEEKLTDLERLSTSRAEAETRKRFVQALMLGLRESKISNPRVVARRVTVTLDPRVLTFDDKSYLRYTILNNSDRDFEFTSISLETSSGRISQTIPVEVVQSKASNRLDPGESMAGVIIFDPKLVGSKDRLSLFVRGEDNSEIAQVNIQ